MDIPVMVETQVPNQGVTLSARYALITSLIYGLNIGLFLGVGKGIASGLSYGLIDGLVGGLVGASVGGLVGGGEVVVKHYILRVILWMRGYIPWNYIRFLDYCADRIFLRKVGGGYIFVHRLLMEHFASLTEEDIKRLTQIKP